jgi:hypothetical protein
MTSNVALALLLCAAVPEPAATPLADNAALQYWLAFARMPGPDRVAETQQKFLENCATAPLDDAAAALAEQYQEALRYLRRAAGLKRCDWGLARNVQVDGLGTAFPHHYKARELARAACLQARLSFRNGRPRAACDDLLTAMALGRHAGLGSGPSGKLLEFAIEDLVIDVLAGNLGGIRDANLLKAVRDRLAVLPATPSMSAAIRGEKDVHEGWIRTHGMKAVEALIEDLQGASAEKKELIRGFLGLEDAAIPRICEEIGRQFNEAARIAALPPAACAAAEKEQRKRLEEEMATTRPLVANVLPRLLLPVAGKLRLAEAKMETRRALLRAALLLAADGDGRIATTKDPFGNGPFRYRKLADGFELTAALKGQREQPIMLRVRTGEPMAPR